MRGRARGATQAWARAALCAGFVLTPLHAALAQAIAAPEAATASAPATLAPISVTGRAAPTASVAGFGNAPLAETPISASIISTEQMRDAGVSRLADLRRIDPAVSDSYNAEGYWDNLSVRGYTIDNRYNYRRDGLPINAQTTIPLDNKERIEVLKGLSGIQSGTSAPGGLVNEVVKRPLEQPLRSVQLGFRSQNSWLGAVDISQRFGVDNAFGLRVNAAYESLHPQLRDMQGHRNLFALAGDWRISRDTLLEAEIETSQRKQPSQPGFSMLGNVLPAPGDPRINLNNQPWSQPNVFEGVTGSLRLQQRLTRDWKLTAHAASQRLHSDDRLAYPFGCSAENVYDRYCSDGTYDLYDFRSDGERRRLDAYDLHATGDVPIGRTRNALTVGVLHTKLRERYNQYANELVGAGNVQGTAFTPGDPSTNYANTNRDERSTEIYLHDTTHWTERLATWIGVRHTRIDRSQIDTDGGAPSSYAQSFTTPWVAATYAVWPGQIAYASWGQGIQSDVAPNLPQYSNGGSALPALKSRQFEVGFKGGGDRFDWNVAAFSIVQPVSNSLGVCDPNTAGSCVLASDGTEDHRGIEANLGYEGPVWGLRGGVQVLHARREGSADPAINGMRPVNVPALSARLQARYSVAAVPGLALLTGVTYDSNRMVLPDNSVRIPALTVFDFGARYEQRVGATRITWRAGIDNLFDKRAWRESPMQYGHVYLYPLAPRAFRLSMQVDL